MHIQYSCSDKFKHLLSSNYLIQREIRRYLIQRLVLVGLTFLSHKSFLIFFCFTNYYAIYNCEKNETDVIIAAGTF